MERTKEQEQENKEFMAHLNRVVPIDKEKSRIAGEKRAREANAELKR